MQPRGNSAERRTAGIPSLGEAASLAWVFQASGLGLFRHEIATGRFEISEGLRKTLGVGADDDLTSIDRVRTYIHRDDWPAIEKAMELALHDTGEVNVQHRLITRTGATRWVMVRGRILRCRETGPVLIGISIDSTAAAESLRASERRHRQLFESPVIGIIHSLTDGRIYDANNKFLETFGYSREDLVEGRLSWRSLTPPEYRHLDDVRLAQLREEGAHQVYEKEYFHKGGSRIPIVLGGTMLEGSDKEIVTFVLDIRDRKRVEAERESLFRSLQRSEERYRLAARASADRIYDWDIEADVARQAVPGDGYENISSSVDWSTSIHPDDRARVLASLSAALARGDQFWEGEYRYRKVNGDWSVILDRGYVTYNEAGRATRLVGVMQDITARRQQECFEKQLIGIVSHDLRNPLSTIVSAAEMLSLLAMRENDEGIIKNVQRVQHAADRATRMIHDLLDFTRARLGAGIPIERKPVCLAPLFQPLVEELRIGHPGRRIEFEAAGDCCGDFDADRLVQVLTNLTENALKYSPPGSPVRITLEHVSMVPTTREILLRVHNYGPAIPADLLPHVFEPLQRGETTFEPARSVGLGLFIVKRLVEAHGGRVDVSSSDAEGTRFDVWLPCHADRASAA